MTFSLPKHYTRRIARAIAEFDLIEDGDNIVVGFSGGKDSAFLVYAMAIFQKIMKIDFKLSVVTVDLGFEEGMEIERMKEYCARLGVSYYVEETKIADTILQDDLKNPCAKCSYFRRGVISKFMKEYGFNKIAYGHHYDDVVETFLMSIIYSGQVKTFEPKSYLSESDIHSIRPLVYIREKDIIATKELIDYQAVKSPCPYDGETKREEIKNLIKSFDDSTQIFHNLAAAMREGDSLKLWPKNLSREDIRDKVKKLWGK